MSILTDPDGFFERRSDDFSLGKAVGVVAVAAAASSLPAIVLLYFQATITPDAEMTLLGTGAVITVVSAFLSMFAFWFVFAGIVHVLATLVGGGSRRDAGEGTFRQLFVFLGWGFVANVFASANKSIAAFLTLQSVVGTYDVDGMGTRVFAAALSGSAAMTVAVFVTVLVLLWRWSLWSFAVKHTYGLPLKRAALFAGVPTVVSITVTLLTNQQFLGL